MKDKPLVVANWKATKTIKDTIEWIKQAKPGLEKINHVEVVICPPFTSLPTAGSLFEGTNVKIGAQDVSKFRKGAYTGEVTIEMIDGLVKYCVVGHSERRKYFGETDEDVFEKVKLLLEYKVTPVLCISDLAQMDSYLAAGKEIIENAEKIIFVYEPPGAISGGGAYRPESPETANENAGKIGKKIGQPLTTIYGGSVNPGNVLSFVLKGNIDGVLPGQASTDPSVFLDILNNIN